MSTKTIEPGIQKMGRQKYRVRWMERGTGERRSRVVNGPLEDARRLRAAMIDSQTRGEYVTPADMTLGQYLDSWLVRHETMGKTRASTHERYRALLASVSERLGDIKLQDLTQSQIEDYYAWCLRNEKTRRGELVGRVTVSKRHTLLKRALEDAVHKDPPLIQRNPAARAEHPTPGKPQGQAFTVEEAQIILAAVHESWIDLPTRIALHTGLRLGEIMALRWRHVDLPGSGPGKLTVAAIVSETASGFTLQPYAKTQHSRRTVSFGDELADELRAHRKRQAERRLGLGPAWEDNDLVCAGQYGQLLRPSKVSARFSPIVRVLEEEGELSTAGATFHALRHTHATVLLREGVPVHVVSKRLGHSKPLITLTYYAHVIPADDEAVALSFDGLISRPHARATMDTPWTQEGMKKAAQGGL